MGIKNSNKSNKRIKNKKINSDIVKKKFQLEFLSNLVENSYVKFKKRNSFCAFNSIYDTFYLIYLTENNSIIFYDIIDNKEIIKIKNAHECFITNIRHYADNNNRRDLIITISLENNNIKLWNVNNFECLLNLKNIYQDGRLFSACFLNDNNNQIYIIASNNKIFEPIKVFDLKGELIKKINIYDVHFIDVFYERKNSKIYILTSESHSVKSYDYINNKIYNIYKGFETPNNEYLIHTHLVINNNEELIESCFDGKIRIWNFHSAMILKVINIINDRYALNCISLWDNKYLFVGCKNTLKIIQLEDGYIFNDINLHNHEVSYIEIIYHPKYGLSLISQCYLKGEIKLFIKSNKLDEKNNFI